MRSQEQLPASGFTASLRKRIHVFSCRMKEKGASLLLTTEKDAIKWTNLPTDSLPVRVLRGRTELLELPSWERLLDSLLKEL